VFFRYAGDGAFLPEHYITERMSHKSSGPIQPIQGAVLLAAPLLRDPHFARSVLYLASHSRKEGAFGYILNRPLDKVVGDLLTGQSLGRLAEVPVFLGGPVATDKLSFASLEWNEKHHSMNCKTHLSMEDAQFEIELGNDVRGFVGYSGWSSGQLERELKGRSWIVATPEKRILGDADPMLLWTNLLNCWQARLRILS
jgi:putative transcriptional regulator